MNEPFDIRDDTPPAPGGATARDYLAGLNPAQREAVETLDGALLVLAGAGTGKTRALTARIAHILVTGRAWPGQILAVTFTNKAAREMHTRVAALVGGAGEGLWLGTFHALGARILRRHAELAGLKTNFTILDEDDQVRLLKQLLEAENIDSKRWPARALGATIQRWKDKGLVPGKVKKSEAGDFAAGRAVKLYAAYQARLRTLNAVDFGDLLLHNLDIFTSHADVLEQYRGRFKYILVDEYQDTNVAQYLWLRLLAQGGGNICCVGDDDQSIYAWRGAEIGNILRFEKDFPGARVVRLEQNYRSSQHILSLASGLIAHNEGRLGKTLVTDRPGGDKPVLRGVWDGEEEARVVADEIEALQRSGHALDEIAVLVRAGFQTREFEERFIRLAIPYRVLGGPRFYERQEIRDAIAYLRVIHQSDDDLAFERIVNTPRRGIGDATARALHVAARAKGRSLTAAARALTETDDLAAAARNSLKRLLADFARWRQPGHAAALVDLVKTVLDESGLTAMWQKSKDPRAPGRLENLKELIVALDEFESLAEFLEHVALVMEAIEGEDTDMVNVMTLHGAKGLEFDTVFLPGWEEGLFPHQRAMDQSGAAGLEEERRLAYVGLTRARHRVHISFAANRRVYGQWQSAIPSRFVDELAPEHVEVATEAGLFGGQREEAPVLAGPAGPLAAAPRDGLVIDSSAEIVAGDAAPARFGRGARVFHQKFGYGTVRAADGDKLQIEFDHSGLKKVMDGFVEPAGGDST